MPSLTVRIAVPIAFVIFTSGARAEDKYVPIVIDQQTYQALVTYLGDVPAKYANPILNMLAQKADEAKKAESSKIQEKKD